MREIARSGLLGRDKLTELTWLAHAQGWLDPGCELPDDHTIVTALAPRKRALSSTAWAAEFKKGAPVSYSMALRYAQQESLEVLIDRTDETGEYQWGDPGVDDPSFWMNANATKKAAVNLCRAMGWKLNSC